MAGRRLWLVLALLTISVLGQSLLLHWRASAVVSVTCLLLTLAAGFDSRLPLILGILLLIVTPMLIAAGLRAAADQTADAAFFLLMIGVLLQVGERWLRRLPRVLRSEDLQSLQLQAQAWFVRRLPTRADRLTAACNVTALLILASHFLLGLTYSVIIPIGEGYDEWAHFAYIRYIVIEHRLPPSGQRLVPEVPFDETHQPPLYYLMGALVCSGIDMSDNLRPAPNTHLQSLGGGRNVFIHSQAENWPYRGSVLGFHVARALSVLLSTITVLATYLIAMELLPARRAVATAALAFVAFMPQLLFIGSIVNNDIAVTAFTALTLLLLVRIAVRGCSGQRVLLLFASLAAAVFSKTNALGLLPAVVIVVGLSLWSRRGKPQTIRLLALSSFLFLGILALLCGWESRNVSMHTHPASIFGVINRVIAPIVHGETASPAAAFHWDALLQAPRYAFQTFWGQFGWGNIPLDEWIYLVLGAECILAAVGDALFFIRHKSSDVPLAWLAVGLVALATLALPAGLLVVTNDLYAAFPGRYILPVAPTVAILLAVGLAEVVPRRGGAFALSTCAFGMLVLATVVPNHYLRPVYSRPPLVTPGELAQVSHPLQLRFGDTIELAGYDLRPASLRPGGTVSISLYWRCLAKMEKDYSVSVQILDPDYNFYGGVNANLGFATYPTSSWRVGDVLKQTHQFEIGATFPSPAFARIKVAVYDTGLKQELPATDANGTPITGQVTFGRVRVSAQGYESVQDTAGTLAAFGDTVLLRGYSVPAQIRAGEEYPLILRWQCSRQMDHDYTVFVQLVDEADQIVAQDDSQPLRGRYPTSLWLPGDTIEDVHELQIPASLEPGRYRILVGFYLLDTLERLPATDESGRPLPYRQFEITIDH